MANLCLEETMEPIRKVSDPKGTDSPCWRFCSATRTLSRGLSWRTLGFIFELRAEGQRHKGRCYILAARLGNDLLARFAESFDAEFYDVSYFQILRRLHAKTNAGWCAGADDIPGQQGHKLADIGNKQRHTKNHFGSRATLAKFAVDLEPHRETAEVGQFVASSEERTKWGE